MFIGDYIDRGPDSKGVIDVIRKFAGREECVFLRGNHEQLLLDAYDSNNFKLWVMNGGAETKKSFGEVSSTEFKNSFYFSFFESTRMYYESKDFFFTHGGLNPSLTIEQNLDEAEHQSFLWQRSHIHFNNPVWEKPVVFGHTPVREVLSEEKKIGIDTGCVYKNHPGLGKLTAVVLPERTFVQQEYSE